MFCLYGSTSSGKVASPAQQRSAAAILMNMLLEGDVAAAAMAMPTVEGLGSMLGKGAEAGDQAATGGPAWQPSGTHHAECCMTWCIPSPAARLAFSFTSFHLPCSDAVEAGQATICHPADACLWGAAQTAGCPVSTADQTDQAEAGPSGGPSLCAGECCGRCS